jgi:hypothetical protein
MFISIHIKQLGKGKRTLRTNYKHNRNQVSQAKSLPKSTMITISKSTISIKYQAYKPNQSQNYQKQYEE